ncbi:MAG: efflux RND transporter periplasmic adaptor subunit [Planctomycetes bacterium]|nr:efflux RND transporter periplasmic adaptor subunit [Planctomycetota bacterium]
MHGITKPKPAVKPDDTVFSHLLRFWQLPGKSCRLMSSFRRGAATTLVVVGMVVPVAAVGMFMAWGSNGQHASPRHGSVDTGRVTRGPLDIKLNERGNIDSANNLTMRSFVEGAFGNTSILKIVEEGSLVEAGEVIVELDSSKLRDELLLQQIRLDAAAAALKNAEADRQIQVMQNESDTAAAKLKLQLAQLDLKSYQGGEYAQQKHLVSSEIAIATEYFHRAQERWEFTTQLLRKGFTTTKVLDADRVAVAKTQVDLAAVKCKEQVLDGYKHRRSLAELESNVAFYQREIGRINLRCLAMLAMRDRSLLARKRQHFLEKQRFDKLQAQIAACTIRSPRAGMVVYANQLEGGRAAPSPLIYEGATIRERQPIIHLPDLTHMRVNARIHESKIAMLREGQEVTVHVDAYQDETFHGVVGGVAEVPNSASWPNINLKEYMAAINLTDDVARLVELKPGMTAEVEIYVDHDDSVVQAPIQACVERAGRYFAWVLEDDDAVTRHEIQVGRTNETETEVLSGLDEGDLVVLNPRRALPEEIALLEQEVGLDTESPWTNTTAPARAPKKPLVPTRPVDVQPKSEDTPAKSPGATEPAPILIVASMPDGDKAPGAASAGDSLAVFDRLDQNHDAQVTVAELPDPMKRVMDRLDTNGDHVIDKEEWRKGTCTVPTSVPTTVEPTAAATTPAVPATK